MNTFAGSLFGVFLFSIVIGMGYTLGIYIINKLLNK